MFERWGAYYLMTGSAGAGMIGLLFFVASLSSTNPTEGLARGMAVYASPTVFHLGVVFSLSVLMNAPSIAPDWIALVVAIAGSTGLVRAGWVIRQFTSKDPPPGFEISDLWYFGIAAAAVYLLLVGNAVLITLGVRFAPWGLGLTILALLLLSAHNAWDLATWLSHPQLGKARKSAGVPAAPQKARRKDVPHLPKE